MTVAETLRERLEGALAPDRLEIVDDSAAHAGHAGARPGGETHFRVRVVSASFAGLGRLARHRLVHAAAGDLLVERIHALALRTETPEEADDPPA